MGVILIILLIAGAIAVFFALDPTGRNQIVHFMQNFAYKVLHFTQHNKGALIRREQNLQQGISPDICS